ncbi:organic cation transporter 1-like [Oratosquilla oratoria]|uniref:organic cation transporter 1-like n=1 Tax=Oratosquilla oratoria TaxID=337810 RepID=UPI003F76753B
MYFDDILNEVGGFGRYQKWKIVIALLPIAFYTGLQNNLKVFQMVVPPYWCHVPGRESTDLTVDQWKNLTLPPSSGVNGTLTKCRQYNVSVTDGIVDVDPVELSCQRGYDYDTTSVSETLITYYGWFCDKESYVSHSFTVYAIANALGTVVMPFIADRYLGRKLIFFIALGNAVFFNLLLTVATSYTFHLVCRFFGALTFQCIWQMPHVILLELISVEKRSLISFLAFMVWTLGMCSTALLTWLVPHWIYFTLAGTAPGLLIFLHWRILPESPRWLLAMERYDECADIMLQIAKTNGRPVPSKNEIILRLKNICDKEEKKGTITDLIRYRNLRLSLFMVMIHGACVDTMYASVVLNVTILPENEALSFAILALSELPSNLVGWLAVHYLGRKAAMHIAFFSSAIFSLAAALNTENKWVLMVLVTFIKFFVAKAVYVLFLFCNELFPTPVRSIVFGMAVVSGLTTMSSAPYINTAGYGADFKYWILLMFSVVGFLAAIPLHETIGLPLPQTYEEANDLGKNRPLTRWIHHWNFKQYTEVDTSEEGGEKNENEEPSMRLDEIKK